jgi:hypothetical protein
VYDLKPEIKLFQELKQNAFLQFCYHDLSCGFAFCSDIMQRVYQLNTSKQEKDHLVNEMFDKLTGTETAMKQYDRPKSQFWEEQSLLMLKNT